MSLPVPAADDAAMTRALELAASAPAHGDVPVGAVVTRAGEVIGEGRNLRERDGDPLAHAEVVALRAAASAVRSWNLEDCTLVVTLEPCVMCAGALSWAQIGRIVYGARDSKRGYGIVENCISASALSLLHPKTEVVGGVLEEECAGLLKEFFARKR